MRLAVLTLSLLLAAPAALAQALPARIDSLARAYMAQTGAPSLVVGVTRGGVRTVAGYGDVRGQVPDAATRYEIGSITKTVTGLVLARAVLRGDVALSTHVEDLLPDSVQIPVVNRAITLGDLASHASGLPRLPAPFMPVTFLDPYADFDAADLMRSVAAARPDSAGVRYAYSNFGVGLLGYVLARREDVGLEALMRREVLGPLGLTATSFTGDVAQPRLTTGLDTDPWSWTDALGAAGALRSDASDLLTLAEAVARPERAPALADAIRLTTTPRFRAAPRLQLGLAWHLVGDGGADQTVFHNGATFGSVAFVGVRPTDDVGLVLLSNIGANGPLDALAGQILQALASPDVP